MTRFAKRLSLRQQVIATAILFFRRFYVRNSYCGKLSFDPLVAIVPLLTFGCPPSYLLCLLLQIRIFVSSLPLASMSLPKLRSNRSMSSRSSLRQGSCSTVIVHLLMTAASHWCTHKAERPDAFTTLTQMWAIPRFRATSPSWPRWSSVSVASYPGLYTPKC